jgi:hypothetical protein
MVNALGSFRFALTASDSYFALVCLKHCFVTAGVGLSAGFGYDLPATSGIHVMPMVRYVYGDVGTLAYSSGPSSFAEGWKQHFLELGLGLKLRG